ncbi:MAG: hypothetical protein GY788_01710, partial [bacterium]|nr:hypothetical protein [bacterium]
MEGEFDVARAGSESALAIDENCQPAAANLTLLQSHELAGSGSSKGALGEYPRVESPGQSGGCRVAIMSFLFNWPSTGGGIIHTVELAEFLGRAGFEVRHFFARNLPWGVGRVEGPLRIASEGLGFDETSWNVS